MSETDSLPSRSIHRLAHALRRLDVRFALVGGVAVALVSTPRFTADVDAVILNVDERLEWLLAELEKEGYVSRSAEQVAMTRRTRVLTLRDENGVGIDLMIGLLPFDEDLVEKAVLARLDDFTMVPVASPEHLVVMKAVAWRAKDQQDIREIISTNPSLDCDYIIRTFTEFAELLEEPERIDILAQMLG